MNTFQRTAGPITISFAILTLLMLQCTTYAEEPTSENTPQLARAIERFPQADVNDDGILTMTEARTFIAARKSKTDALKAKDQKLPPDFADVAYDKYDKTKLDLWLPKNSDQKASTAFPLAIYIHGGGFRGGDKQGISTGQVQQLLDNDIAVASLNYRLTDEGPFPMPMNDCARAIQFLRLHAEQYRLDKERFACFGGSAGGCLSMWLAMHDDLADPDHKDPVCRESTRILCAAPSAGQSSLNFNQLFEWFDVQNLSEHSGGRPLFGVSPQADLRKELQRPEMIVLMNEASPIHHLTRDDPPIFASYGSPDNKVTETTAPGTWVHHPRLGIKLKEAMDRLGLECHVQYPGGPSIEPYHNATEFLIRKLKGA